MTDMTCMYEFGRERQQKAQGEQRDVTGRRTWFVKPTMSHWIQSGHMSVVARVKRRSVERGGTC